MKSYIDNLLEEATNLMTSTWGTEKLPIPKSMEAPFMKMIRLPPVDMIGDVDNSLVPVSTSFTSWKAYHIAVFVDI